MVFLIVYFPIYMLIIIKRKVNCYFYVIILVVLMKYDIVRLFFLIQRTTKKVQHVLKLEKYIYLNEIYKVCVKTRH